MSFEFEQDKSYAIGMGGTHRRQAIAIAAPAVSRHVAFWSPQSDLERDRWVQDVERFILALYDDVKTRKGFSTPNYGDRNTRLYLLENSYDAAAGAHGNRAPVDAINRYQTANFGFGWRDMNVDLGVELHHEYVTLTATIQLPQQPPAAGLGATLRNAVETFNRHATERQHQVQAHRPAKQWPKGGRAAFKAAAHDPLYLEVWRQLNDEVLAGPFAAAGGADRIGRSFADFRSLVLTRGGGRGGDFLAFPQPASALASAPDRRTFATEDALAAAEVLRPFIELGGEAGEPVEHTFTREYRDHVLYGSSLGTRPQGAAQPLTELFLMAQNDPAQLGRILDTSHALGTLRLAALYGLDEIGAANRKLQALEAEMAKDAAAEGEESVEKERKRMRDYETKLAAIETATEAGPRFGGLPYRLTRSRHYRAQFEHLLPTLDSHTVGSQQSYGDFIDRNLTGIYNFVDIVGRRDHALHEALTAMNRKLRTDDLLERTRKIEEFQRTAEIAFFLILLPYYAGHDIADIIPDGEKLLKELPALQTAVTAGLFLSGLAFVSREWIQRKYEESHEVLKLGL